MTKKTKVKAQNQAKAKPKPTTKTKELVVKEFYINDEAKNWDFADRVRVSSGPRGMLLSFSKFIRDNKEFGIFKEVLIPYDTAESLIQIMQNQLEELYNQGLLDKIDTTEEK